MRGIAFPIAPISKTEAIPIYNPDGWIAILIQLRQASSKLNTIRLYHLDIDRHDYSVFFERARQLGFYLLVPLTTDAGAGVLDRNVPAPNCYSPELYNHGRRILDMTWAQYPNIVGGVLGNEVMNSQPTWAAAPCVMAYARDLKLHEPRVPLIYTMQHDGLGAAISPAAAVQLTLEYMTVCGTNSSIDVLGVNIESWCSSLQTFERNEDGSVGSYLDLYNHLLDASASIPLIFSEVGCSLELFNRDNGLERYSRDWKQLSVVESENKMGNLFSGFIAYAYDGPPPFRMTQGGPWDGVRPLPFAKDMDNFMTQLEQLKDENATTKTKMSHGHGSMLSRTIKPPTCRSVMARLEDHGGETLLEVDKVPSYYVPHEIALNATVREIPDNTAAGGNDNNNAGAAGGLVTSILHNPIQTVLVMMLIMILVLVPYCRNKLSAYWRDTACVHTTLGSSSSHAISTTIPNGNNNNNNTSDAAGIAVAGQNYDTFT